MSEELPDPDDVICPECGEKGRHFIADDSWDLDDPANGGFEGGFWICAKFYENGRRKV